MDAVLFHDGQVNGITPQVPLSQYILGMFRCGPGNVQHLVNDAQQSVEGRLNGVPAIDMA